MVIADWPALLQVFSFNVGKQTEEAINQQWAG